MEPLSYIIMDCSVHIHKKGCTIKNGYQRKWFDTSTKAINQKSVVTTFAPYIYTVSKDKYWPFAILWSKPMGINDSIS